MSERIFGGLKVIDCASYIAGPAAATVMSDFGAEIVKIEPPGAGDPYRRRATPPIGKAHPRNPHWVLDARNKKSLALNLATAAGHGVLERLVKQADVFITNYPPRVRRQLRIRYEDLAPLNERLIYASFTGYGETGPEADKPGFDATAWWARSGLMHLVRSGAETAPARSLPGMGDHPSAMGTYGAIVTALYQRERTGKGTHVGSSLLANGLWANGCHVQATLCGETIVPQPPREQGVNALRMHYRCRDGRWLLLSIVSDERRWHVFKTCLESDALEDSRFATAASRESHARELIAVLDDAFAIRDLAEWRQRLDAAGLVFGVVAEPDDIADDSQMRECGALVPFADGSLLTVSSPFWVAGQQKVPPRHAPEVGEHSEEVLRAAGYAETEIAAMRADGVIG
ncbi:MAG: CoA transferase [Alphaproteobacteria bacterium]|nr:CoA transferase [Alphaproteobacteria bacterium]